MGRVADQIETRFHTHTVNVYAFRRSGFDAEFLLLQRRPSRKWGDNRIWQVVCGKVDEGETHWQAALRELFEEAGLRPLRVFETGVESYYSYQREAICMHPSFAVEVAQDSEVRLSDEHERFEWLPFDEALIRLPFPNQREMITRVRFNVVDAPELIPFEIPEDVWKTG